MKIAIVGYGKMGKMVEGAAEQKGHQVICRIDPKCDIKEIRSDAIRDADVCIDFSTPDCALENIKRVAQSGKNLVMGTTGWYDQMDTVKAIVAKSQIGFLYAPNFSLGIHLFLKIVAEAARLMHPYEEYDVGAMECHHKHKADAPSGTAKAIAQTVVKHLGRPGVTELPFANMRCGTIPGIHTIVFDSPADRITLTHEARNRNSFADGAVAAAEWLQGKSGFYTIDELWQP